MGVLPLLNKAAHKPFQRGPFTTSGTLHTSLLKDVLGNTLGQKESVLNLLRGNQTTSATCFLLSSGIRLSKSAALFKASAHAELRRLLHLEAQLQVASGKRPRFARRPFARLRVVSF